MFAYYFLVNLVPLYIFNKVGFSTGTQLVSPHSFIPNYIILNTFLSFKTLEYSSNPTGSWTYLVQSAFFIRFYSLGQRRPHPILVLLFMPLWITCSQNLLNHLVFQSFDYVRIWWRLFQKHHVSCSLNKKSTFFYYYNRGTDIIR